MGQRARMRIQAGYSWDRNMKAFEALLCPSGGAVEAAG